MGKPKLAQYAKEDGTGRAYKHPSRLNEEGKPVTSPSVTTVLGLVDKPALIQWAADRTLDWAVDNLSLLYVKERDSAIRWGRYRWADVRDERAEVGTGVHETLESMHTGGWVYPPLNEEQQQIMAQWELLTHRYEYTPRISEFTVWGEVTDLSQHRDWAGTADTYGDITDLETGETWTDILGDFKTSKNTWPEHWMQLAALANAEVLMREDANGWTELPMPNVNGVAVFHLRADKWDLTIETDRALIDERYQQFLSYRDVWQHKKNVERMVLERDKGKALAF